MLILNFQEDWRDEDHAVIQRSDVREFIKLLRVGFLVVLVIAIAVSYKEKK